MRREAGAITMGSYGMLWEHQYQWENFGEVLENHGKWKYMEMGSYSL
jgi:hypothetical protein